MLPGNILSVGMQVEAYCPPGDGKVPGIPELAYQPLLRTISLRHRITWRVGKLLIQLGKRLITAGRPSVRWVEDMT